MTIDDVNMKDENIANNLPINIIEKIISYSDKFDKFTQFNMFYKLDIKSGIYEHDFIKFLINISIINEENMEKHYGVYRFNINDLDINNDLPIILYRNTHHWIYRCKNLTSVIIYYPNSYSVGNHWLSNCNNLESVIIYAPRLKSVGIHWLSNCTNLESVKLDIKEELKMKV